MSVGVDVDVDEDETMKQTKIHQQEKRESGWRKWMGREARRGRNHRQMLLISEPPTGGLVVFVVVCLCLCVLPVSVSVLVC